jgi:tripeptide aminopeptidase
MSLTQRILDLAIEIQQIPAPTCHESERAEFIRQRFEAEGLLDIEIDAISNVYARLPGTESNESLVVSAHSDTVFSLETDLSVTRLPERIKAPGIGDNSLGVAGLLGLVWEMKDKQVELPGDLWLVANVCEEGLGDLNGMRAVVNRFGEMPLAYLVIEGMAYGNIYHRGLGVWRYRISVDTKGGHSWVDYGRPSAVHEIGFLVAKLASIKMPRRPRTTLNIGTIQGGISVNSIAPHASFDIDLRSTDAIQLAWLEDLVRQYVASSNRRGVKFTMEQIGERPTGRLACVHPLVKLAVKSLEAQGINPDLKIGSTDANIPLSKNIPAICIGITTGGCAHSMDEFINTDILAKGMEHLRQVVEGAFEYL